MASFKRLSSVFNPEKWEKIIFFIIYKAAKMCEILGIRSRKWVVEFSSLSDYHVKQLFLATGSKFYGQRPFR